MKPKVIVGVIAIVGFTALLMVNFGNSIGTYTNFKDAANMDKAHVVGTWDSTQSYGFSIKSKEFTFFMKDQKGEVRRVVYPKPKPNNFEEAKKIVVVGDMKDGVFYAHHMLMKCPSKYNADGSEKQLQAARSPQS